MSVLTVFLTIHSAVYWGVLQFAHTTKASTVTILEPMFEPIKKPMFRDLIANFCMNTLTLLHLGGMISAANPTVLGLDLYEKTASPSHWVVSQYALEMVVSGMFVMRHLWNPLERIRFNVIAPQMLGVFMLCLSYWRDYTNVGTWILTIMNSTNLFYDYLKYGRLMDDIYIEVISSVLYWVMTLMRTHMLGSLVLLPLYLEYGNGTGWMASGGGLSVFSEPTLMVLCVSIFFGLQCIHVYKQTCYTGAKMKKWVLHPSVLPHIPDGILTYIEPMALMLKKHLIEQEYDSVVHTVSSHAIPTDDDAVDAAVDAAATVDDANANADPVPNTPEPIESQEPPPLIVEEPLRELEKLQGAMEQDIKEILSQWRNMLTTNLEELQEGNKKNK